MEQRRTCDTHDMRPMPSMRATVCRRCGYYEPQRGYDDDTPPVSAFLRRLTFTWVALTFCGIGLWMWM